MAKSVWYRTRLVGKDEVVIMLKRWGWPVGWRSSYHDYASISSHCNRLEAEILNDIQKLRGKISTLVEAQAMQKENVAFAKNRSSHNHYGVSEPIKGDLATIKSFGQYYAKPDIGLIYEALNPKWLAKQGFQRKNVVGESTSSATGDKAPRGRGTSHAYVATDQDTLDQHSYQFKGDADGVSVYKEPDKKKSDSSSGMKEWKKRFREDHPIETTEYEDQGAYEKWIQRKWNEHNS